MLGKEDFMVIQALVRRGVYLCDIARQLGVHPKTVSRALARGAAPSPTRKKRTSLLDPYRAHIDQLLAQGVWNGVVILRELQARGFAGEISIVRDYIRPKRALRPGRATVRFETAPGHQLQGDWGELRTLVGGREVDVHFAVHTLGYSRRFHFWNTDREDAEHTYEGLIRACEWFGGVAAEVLVDNQKSAVLEHRADGVRFNARFLDLAGHYGFTPRACRPARARTKGKDERMVGYVKHHFFVRYRAFDSWAHLNQLAEQWLREEADQRRHGTVHEIVAERFVHEAAVLRPLPTVRYDTSYWELRQVAWDAYIDVRGNRYSVPAALAGQRVAIRITLEDVVRVFAGDQLVAEHRLRPVTEGWVQQPEHHAPLWQAVRVEQRPLAVYAEVGQWS
jgi:transposase